MSIVLDEQTFGFSCCATASPSTTMNQLMIRNENVYRLARVAASYAKESDLQPPEKTILGLMLPNLQGA